MFDSSCIELNTNNLKANIRFINSLLGDNCLLCAVVKGNAYGHGIEEFVPLVEMCGVRHFAVYSADEAEVVYRVSVNNSHIMIMGYLNASSIEWAVNKGISFYIFDMERLYMAVRAAIKYQTKAKIHIELETGMNRTGMDEHSLKMVLSFLKEHPDHIELLGVCTHFAGAETSSNFEYIERQMSRFLNMYDRFSEATVAPKFIHTSCSAGLVNFPQYKFDMVRIGIMLYGFWPNQETKKRFLKSMNLKTSPLKRVISWKSRIMAIKRVEKGEYIGYGKTYLTDKKMVIAIVPVGYAHGFSRSLSNRGYALVQGLRVAVVGIVNMNCIALDITNCSSANVDDEVVLIGKQGNREITVQSFSETVHVLNYELLTRLPGNIPRTITSNGLPDIK